MTAGIKANVDGSGAIQVGGSDYITISSAGAVAIPQTLSVPTIKSATSATPPTIQDSAGTQIGTFCRAWVNFNGTTNTGGFCTIRGSFNVSSVADNGTGDYTINFTTAMPDANYTAAGICGGNVAGPAVSAPIGSGAASPTTTALRVGVSSVTQYFDPTFVNIAVFR